MKNIDLILDTDVGSELSEIKKECATYIDAAIMKIHEESVKI